MRKLLLLAFAMSVCSVAMAQNVDDVVSRLAQRSVEGSHVRVEVDDATRSAVDAV